MITLFVDFLRVEGISVCSYVIYVSTGVFVNDVSLVNEPKMRSQFKKKWEKTFNFLS